MPPLAAVIIAAAGILLIIFIGFAAASNSGLNPLAAIVFAGMVATVTVMGIAFVRMPHKSSCNQITISAKNGIACSASKGKGK